MIIDLFVLRLLRQVSDGYLIKSELKFIAMWGVVVFVIFALPVRLQRQMIVQIIFFLLGNMLIFHTSTWKVYQTYRFERVQKSSTSRRASNASRRESAVSINDGRKMTLRRVLDDPHACKKFRGALFKKYFKCGAFWRTYSTSTSMHMSHVNGHSSIYRCLITHVLSTKTSRKGLIFLFS